MKNEIKRRAFVTSCFKAGAACIVLSGSNHLLSGATPGNEKPDPKNLEYCGYKCPADCLLKKATVENNLELKKKAYVEFKIKEKHGIDFDADKVFCWGCKVGNKPSGIVVKDCEVRKCVISKGLDCCIQCDGLSQCDKKLWLDYPQFKTKILELQKQYKS